MGVRLKWCGDELDPLCLLRCMAEQVTWFVLSPVCSARGRLSRGTRPLSQDSAERARHARCSAKGPKPVSARVPQPWRVVSYQLVAVVTAASTSSRRERARGEVRVVRACPPTTVRAAPVTSVGSRAHTSRVSGRSEVTPVNNEGVSPLSCARTHGGGEETTTLR